MTNLDGAHVLIVGATGGLGGALARRFASSGARLTLSGRDDGKLGELASDIGDQVAAVVAADLTLPGGPAQVAQAAQAGGPVDVVVNAAGIVAFGPALEIDDDVLDELLLVNLIAPVRLLREVAPHLAEKATVVNISAVVSEKPTAGMAAYSASKAALTAFGAAAGHELRRRGVRVLDVRPPHTETGLAGRPVAGEAPRLGEGLAPDAVAARIVEAVQADERDLPSSAFTPS